MNKIEQLADKLRETWNITTQQIGVRWECLNERSRRGYLAVAEKAIEELSEPHYRVLEQSKDTLTEGDEWRNLDHGVTEWKPITDPAWFGSKLWNSTAEFRRPVVEQEYRDLTVDDTIQPGDEVWEFGNGPWGPVSVSEHGQQYRNGYWRMRRPVAAEETIDDVREAWQKDHMEMKRKLDAVVAESQDERDRLINTIGDRNAAIRRLREKLENIEPLVAGTDTKVKYLMEKLEKAARYINALEEDLSFYNTVADMFKTKLESAAHGE